ncbi:MAG: hypothetical protein ACLFU6_08855 [Candidatus Hydrogenedentota bacterium]
MTREQRAEDGNRRGLALTAVAITAGGLVRVVLSRLFHELSINELSIGGVESPMWVIAAESAAGAVAAYALLACFRKRGLRTTLMAGLGSWGAGHLMFWHCCYGSC